MIFKRVPNCSQSSLHIKVIISTIIPLILLIIISFLHPQNDDKAVAYSVGPLFFFRALAFISLNNDHYVWFVVFIFILVAPLIGSTFCWKRRIAYRVLIYLPTVVSLFAGLGLSMVSPIFDGIILALAIAFDRQISKRGMN